MQAQTVFVVLKPVPCLGIQTIVQLLNFIPLKQSGEFMGDISMSQFIPASPSPSLCDSLGKITFTGMKKNIFCLPYMKLFIKSNLP